MPKKRTTSKNSSSVEDRYQSALRRRNPNAPKPQETKRPPKPRVSIGRRGVKITQRF
jgi:hypothetical protein